MRFFSGRSMLAESAADADDGEAPGGADSPAVGEDLEIEQIAYEAQDDSDEVRGPVTGPARSEPTGKAPAEMTWKNDEKGKPDPRPEDLRPQMRESLENIRAKTPGLESINVNSGKRPGGPSADPHADGRAVDINKINGFPVKVLGKAEGLEAEQARMAADKMVERSKREPYVNQVLGPAGCWKRDARGKWEKIEPDSPKNEALIKGHMDHYHINVYRK